MEQQRLIPRRSASHGTLHSSFSTHGRPLHKPLRSVHENSVLLPSPGALESMLKTTTETGDIGIFSIKPVSTSSNLGIPTRTKPGIGHGGQQNGPLRRATDAAYRHDDRRRIPMFRDATSEILSMYGSNSQGSVSTSNSPIDEMGQRSYSMTTCGSRNLSHNKSNGTLQSHASATPLQRPRSPFPYPTRLRRPGTRPVSPAMTDTGHIDYSRTVEIDRTPLRTNQGSLHPPLHPPPPRRPPPPLGMRSDVNLSNASLHSQNPLPLRLQAQATPAPRATSAGSMVSWSPYYRERLPSASSRASSLTSVINMYHRIPPALRGQVGPVAPPPRYYDYTEQFESRQARSITPLQPIAPIPTRAPSSQRHLVLRDGSEEQLAAALGVEPESALFDDDSQVNDTQVDTVCEEENGTKEVFGPNNTLGRASIRPQAGSTRPAEFPVPPNHAENGRSRKMRGSDIDRLPSQAGRDSIDTFNPNLDVESSQGVTPYGGYQAFRATPASKANTASPGRHAQVHCCETTTVHSEKGVILKEEDSQLKDPLNVSRKTPFKHAHTLSKPLLQSNHTQEMPKTPRDAKRFSSPRRRVSPVHLSKDSSRPDFEINSGSAPKSSHEPTNAPRLDESKVSLSREKSVSSIASNASSPRPLSSQDAKDMDRNDGNLLKSDSHEKTKFRRHKRNHAVLDILTKDLPKDDLEVLPHLRPSCSTTPLISPKPISPARQLKVKNSIPQLMKALPPIPKDDERPLPPTPSTEDDEEFGEILEPFIMSPSGTPKAAKSSSVALPGSRVLQDASNRLPSLQTKILKVRQKPKGVMTETTSSRTFRTWDSGSHYPWPMQLPDIKFEGSDYDENRRLATHNAAPLVSTLRRRPDEKQSGISPKLIGSKNGGPSGYTDRLSSDFYDTDRRRSYDSNDSSKASSIIRGYSEDNAHQAETRSGFIGKTGRNAGAKNTYPSKGSTLKNSRGLMKSISSLRSLLARTSNAQLRSPKPERHTTQGRIGQRNGLERSFESGNAAFDRKYLSISEGIAPEPLIRPRFRRRLRDKISKWVKGTKTAVISRGKRTHSA